MCVYDCPLLQLFQQPQHRGLDQFLPLYSAQPCPPTCLSSARLPQNTEGNEYLSNLPGSEDKSEALSRAWEGPVKCFTRQGNARSP